MKKGEEDIFPKTNMFSIVFTRQYVFNMKTVRDTENECDRAPDVSVTSTFNKINMYTQVILHFKGEEVLDVFHANLPDKINI